MRLSQLSLEVEPLVDLNVFMLLFIMLRRPAHIGSLDCLLPIPLTELQVIGDNVSGPFLPLRNEEMEDDIPKPASSSATLSPS